MTQDLSATASRNTVPAGSLLPGLAPLDAGARHEDYATVTSFHTTADGDSCDWGDGGSQGACSNGQERKRDRCDGLLRGWRNKTI